MKIARLAPLAALRVAAITTAVRAQDHPLEAPGFVPNKAYDVHDYDSINTMSGNLVVSIPIGPSFHVNGGLSYGLTLHYNSKLWYWQHNSDPAPQDGPACQIKLQNPRWDCGTAWADP